MATNYDASFLYTAATPTITGDTETVPELPTITATITNGTVAAGDVLRFFVTTTITGFTALSWEYTVVAGDDFATVGKAFTLSGPIANAISGTPTFSAGKVYKGSEWGFKAA